MATDQSPQRSYSAACPNCGASVEFRSPASAFAVCSYCRSSIVRDGESLRRIGQSAELFDDHSPLQLGASGSYLGQAFTLVGRLQFATSEGSWNEWHALFDGRTADSEPRVAWLSEDNGRYVLAFDAPFAGAASTPDALAVGQQIELAGQLWSVASVVQAKLLAAEGELPSPPVTDREFAVVDLRNSQGEVATLDYSEPARPSWAVGRSVALSEMAMSGLAEARDKTLGGRGVECPNCGTALQVKLDSTKAIVCDNCKAVVDISAGVGGDLQHYVQNNRPHSGAPQIALGSSGNFKFDARQPLPWQVVGYLERFEVPDEAGDEKTYWREYLLYNRSAGFVFLVDSDDGWSWVAPLTGVPDSEWASASYQGVKYRKLFDYRARVSYVLGEFYWRVERDQETYNTDFSGTGKASRKRLNRERSVNAQGQEIVWSAGETIDSDAVRTGFGLSAAQGAAIKRDAAPVSFNPHGMLAKAFFLVFIIAVLLMMFRCSDDGGCDNLRSTYGSASQEYQSCVSRNRPRTGGGAFGGFSSGGFHK